MEETRISGDRQGSVSSNWQTLSHIVVSAYHVHLTISGIQAPNENKLSNIQKNYRHIVGSVQLGQWFLTATGKELAGEDWKKERFIGATTFTFTGILWKAVKQHQLTGKLLWRGFHTRPLKVVRIYSLKLFTAPLYPTLQ